jgi:potassium-transporting ATPase KdpC subunit
MTMKLFLSQARPATSMIVLMTLLLGIAYPLAMVALGQAVFPTKANGSMIELDGALVGSEQIGQQFTDPHYLIGRPSAVDYDAANSSGTNLAPTSSVLIGSVAERVEAVRQVDGVARPPVDLVTASGSGLDPHLWVRSAMLQADRIARLRGAEPEQVRAIILQHVEGDYLGFIGEPVVNVLLVNLALDAAYPRASWPAGDAPAEAAAAAND